MREELEGRKRGGSLQRRGLRIDGAQCAEERTVPAQDRHGDIALETVLARGVVRAVLLVQGYVIDHDGLPMGAHFITERRGERQLSAG